MTNIERRKSNRVLYRAIERARKARSFNRVGEVNMTTKEAATLVKMTRQSSRKFRIAADMERSEKTFYARDFYSWIPVDIIS